MAKNDQFTHFQHYTTRSSLYGRDYTDLEYSIEFDSDINQEARTMYDPVLEIENGNLHLPAEPGWGIRIDREWLDKVDHQASELD